MNRLFAPFDLAGLTLKNRIVMAPLTRSRAPEDIATERIALYYAQRATAGLIISEGTPISREGQGYLFNPGIYSSAQIEGWKLTTQSVHAVGGRIFAQLWHVGRVSHTTIQEQGQAPVAPSAILAQDAMSYGYQSDGTPAMIQASMPRALDTAEVERVVQDFAQAAENAMAAGFDGVEIHGANGYLLEQFLNPHVNTRTDKYEGATRAGRIRFVLEVVDAVVAKIGKERVGLRLSPYNQIFDMALYEDLAQTYQTLIKELGQREIAYVHFNDPTRNNAEVQNTELVQKFDALLEQTRSWLPKTALMLAGSLDQARAEELLERGVIDLAVFGRPFISNPDLVARLQNNWPLSPADRDTFYGGDGKGYIDYPPYTTRS